MKTVIDSEIVNPVLKSVINKSYLCVLDFKFERRVRQICIGLSDAPKYDIIWTENSNVIDSFISEILKYKSWILACPGAKDPGP